MENKLVFHDQFMIVDESREIYPMKLVPHDGWIPMLIARNQYKSSKNPYFYKSWDRPVRSRVTGSINPLGTGMLLKYRKCRNYSTAPTTLFSGFLSVIGARQDFEYMSSSMFTDDPVYRLVGDVDIFCLGLVKVSGLPDIQFSKGSSKWIRRRVADVTFDPANVKILVSTEKLRKTLFTKTHYTATVRKTILNELERAKRYYKITLEDVPEDYIEKFVIRPNSVRTNSIVEVMQLNNEIKDSVFSNLNELLV